MDPSRCRLDGLNLQEVGLRGDVVCQSGQPLTAPVSFPGPEGGPVPLGAHPEGAWLVEGLPDSLGGSSFWCILPWLHFVPLGMHTTVELADRCQAGGIPVDSCSI